MATTKAKAATKPKSPAKAGSETKPKKAKAAKKVSAEVVTVKPVVQELDDFGNPIHSPF